jgi:cell division septation protein DedD
MTNFSFQKRSAEEERFPEEEGTELGGPEESSRQTGGVRGLLIIAGIIVVVLIGGWYLARPLFFAPPASRSVGPVQPVAPAPQANAPAPITPGKETASAPAAPAQLPSKEETKASLPGPSGKAVGSPSPAKESVPGKVAVATPSPEKMLTPEKPGPPPKAAEKAGLSAAPASFSLQIGAMVMEENADALKRKLDGSGFPAVIRKGTAYVTKQFVTVGEPTGKREAEDLSRRLNVDGFPSQLLSVGDKYTPQIGAFFNLDEAIDLARELQKKKYAPKITSKPATTVVYQVRHGKFDSRASAVRRGEELKGKGFSFLVVRE